MKKLAFTKMHGVGNDFIVINNYDLELNKIKLTPNIIKTMCHRNFGIGSDGLLIVDKGEKTEFKYIMHNPDGTRAEMCGNGIRCYMKYLLDNNLTTKKTLDVETDNGVLTLKIEKDLVTVDMGKPTRIKGLGYENKKLGDVFIIKAYDKTFKFIPISVGNPHAVVFLSRLGLDELEIEKYGKFIELETNIFPEKTNVEFMKPISDIESDMRVWERGAAETLGCGTGATAAVAAGILNGLFKPNEFIKINLLGGVLEIKWSGNQKDSIIMRGPAETVYEGFYNIK